MLYDQRPIYLNLIPTQRYSNLLVSTVKTVENTHNSARFSTAQVQQPEQSKDRKRLPIFDSNKISPNQLQQSSPITRIGTLRFKTTNSDQVSDSDKKNEAFFESQKHVRRCTSYDKNKGRSSVTRRHKIFDGSYLARANQEINSPIYCNSNKQIEEDSTRNLVQKLQMMFPKKDEKEVASTFHIREKSLQEQFKSVICNQESQPSNKPFNINLQPIRMHATPNTVFSAQPLQPNEKKNITFTYQNRNHLPHHCPPINAHPLANSYTMPSSSNIRQGITTSPRFYAESHVAQYVNSASFKIQDRPATKSIVKQTYHQNNKKQIKESDRRAYIPTIAKTRAVFQKNQFVQQATISKTGAQLKQSLIRSGARLTNNNIQTARSFSNIEEANTERYFDDQDMLPMLAKRISYKNIDIIKKEEESIEETQIDPRNLFIDFQASRRKSVEKQPLLPNFVSKDSIPQETMMILSNSTLNLIAPKDSQPLKMQSLVPKLLIILAVLLLLIQMIR